MKGLVIKANGQQSYVTPNNGTDFTLTELQTIVGGSIEILRLGKEMIMVVNEEGHMLGLPFNQYASMFTSKFGIVNIVGDVLICKSVMVK